MQHLLLITQPNSYKIAAFLSAAKSLSIRITIASHGEYSLISEVHQGLYIDLNNPDAALKKIIQRSNEDAFHGVLGCDDSTVELAARVGQHLNLIHNHPNAARISQRKDLARAELSIHECPVPLHCLIDIRQSIEPQLVGLPWPCVLKPLNLSASRGVIRANDPNEFKQAVKRIQPIINESTDTFTANHLLIEEYIDGLEVAFEGYLEQDTLHTLAIFDKPDPLVGPFFCETIYTTPSLLSDPQKAAIKQRVAQACQAYGLSSGPIHAELRLDYRDAWILEVASRTIGGDCARTLDLGGGFNLEELAISLALGKPYQQRKNSQARGVMMLPITKSGLLREINHLEKARAIAYITSVEIAISYGHELIPLPEGNQYLGYIFASAEKPEQVTQALRLAYQSLDIRIAPLWKIQKY